jgi:hypothetical protein
MGVCAGDITQMGEVVLAPFWGAHAPGRRDGIPGR